MKDLRLNLCNVNVNVDIAFFLGLEHFHVILFSLIVRLLHYVPPKNILLMCLKISPLQVKSSNLYLTPKVLEQGGVSGLYRATPVVTRHLGFCHLFI